MDTSFLSQLNWLAILVASVAYFMLGALWYSKLLFANTWIKSTGVDMNNPDAKKGVGGIMAFTFILEFVVSIGLAILVYRLGLSTWMSGVKLGLKQESVLLLQRSAFPICIKANQPFSVLLTGDITPLVRSLLRLFYAYGRISICSTYPSILVIFNILVGRCRSTGVLPVFTTISPVFIKRLSLRISIWS